MALALFLSQYDCLVGVTEWHTARVAASFCETMGRDILVTLIDRSIESLEPLAQSYRTIEDFSTWTDGLVEFSSALLPFMTNRRHFLQHVPYPTDWSFWNKNPLPGIHWWKWLRGRAAIYDPVRDSLLTAIASYEVLPPEERAAHMPDWIEMLSYAHTICESNPDADWMVALDAGFNTHLRTIARRRDYDVLLEAGWS